MSELTILSAILLGIVEGLTEFLPVSSTGHLILTSSLLGLQGKDVRTFEIFVQAGAILAVVLLYLRRFVGLLNFKDGFRYRPESFAGVSGLVKLAVCCLPVFVVGGIFGSSIKEHLFSPSVVASALITGGLAMILLEQVKRVDATPTLEAVSLKQCFAIGVIQCLALWPGFSRSASTILGGMVMGLSRSAAAELSFLVAVPVLCAAVVLDLLQNISHLGPNHVFPFAVGFIVSFFTALLAVRGFIVLLGKFSLVPFAVYRIVLGALVLTVWAEYFGV